MESAIEHYQKKVHDAEKKLSKNTANATLASRDLERVNEMERQLNKEKTEIKFQVMSLRRQREEIEAKGRKTKNESEVLKAKEKKKMKIMEATWRQLQKQKILLDAARKRFSAEKFETTWKSRALPRGSITSDTSPLFTPNSPKKRSKARGRSRLDMNRNSIDTPFTTAQIAFEPCIDSSDSDFLDLEKSLQVAFDDENDISTENKSKEIWNLTIPNVSRKNWKESQSVICLKEGEYGGSRDVAITMRKNMDDNTQIGPLHSRESPASHYPFMSSIKLGNEMDVNDKFESGFTEIENSVKDLSDWIVETNNNLNSLPSAPSTLRGLLASIDPKRLKKVKLKLAKITELIEETDSLIESNEELIRDSFSDRMWELVSMEKECDLQIRRIEKVLNNKLAMAAVHFRKFMPRLLKEYWGDSKNVRDALESIQKRYSNATPAPRNSKKGRSEIREALQDEAKMKELKDMVDFLIKVGRIFGNIGTEETQDCLLDSYDLESKHLALSKKISVRISQGSTKST